MYFLCLQVYYNTFSTKIQVFFSDSTNVIDKRYYCRIKLYNTHKHCQLLRVLDFVTLKVSVNLSSLYGAKSAAFIWP